MIYFDFPPENNQTITIATMNPIKIHVAVGDDDGFFET